jgi:phage shock protein B
VDGPEILVPILVVGMLFIGLPWIILHYVSKWKTAATLTTEDERLLEDLHELARRLDDRMCTVERILQADNPNWRQLGCDPVETMLEDRQQRMLADRNDPIERGERAIRRNA